MRSDEIKEFLPSIRTSLVVTLVVIFICWVIEKIYHILSENCMVAIVAFVSIVVLIFVFIIKNIYKCNQKVSKIFVIIGLLSIILIIGIIAIINYIPCNPPEYIVVPDLIGKDIVPASYEAHFAGLKLDPIRVEGNIINFQDPQEGSSVIKNSLLKVVIGKPTIEISTPIDNTCVHSSYCYITGNSFGVASNPNLKMYTVLSNFSIFQVQKVPPPHSTGTWYGKCSFENLKGEQFLIYAIITTHNIQNEQNDSFPIYIDKTGPVSIKRHI